ncbi:MAG: hypothetical protein J0J02_09230 [Thiobacillus sp.]|nr:hypothetical protein [Thiobacillus sp.]
MATDKQFAAAMFYTDHKAAADDRGKHQHTPGTLHHFPRARGGLVQALQRCIHAGVQRGAIGSLRRTRLGFGRGAGEATVEMLPTTTAAAITAERMETVCIQNPFLGDMLQTYSL